MYVSCQCCLIMEIRHLPAAAPESEDGMVSPERIDEPLLPNRADRSGTPPLDLALAKMEARLDRPEVPVLEASEELPAEPFRLDKMDEKSRPLGRDPVPELLRPERMVDKSRPVGKAPVERPAGAILKFGIYRLKELKSWKGVTRCRNG
jgi:hypothetical protein